MKTISLVLISCYSAKQWIEWRKRKQFVRKELNKMKPRLYLYKTNGEFNCIDWRTFMRNHNVKGTTMQVLLEAPGEKFFSCAKQTQNKNRSIEGLSPYTKEFFQVFLKQKKRFVKRIGRAFFRPYISMNNKLGPWLENNWEMVYHNLILRIIDFRSILHFSSLSKTTAQKPYFKEFMGFL
jgi:hypothetical protein